MPSRVRRLLLRGSREYAALQHAVWFRAGYVTALKDVERTGLRPVTPDTMRAAANRALRGWIES